MVEYTYVWSFFIRMSDFNCSDKLQIFGEITCNKYAEIHTECDDIVTLENR